MRECSYDPERLFSEWEYIACALLKMGILNQALLYRNKRDMLYIDKKHHHFFTALTFDRRRPVILYYLVQSALHDQSVSLIVQTLSTRLMQQLEFIPFYLILCVPSISTTNVMRISGALTKKGRLRGASRKILMFYNIFILLNHFHSFVSALHRVNVQIYRL